MNLMLWDAVNILKSGTNDSREKLEVLLEDVSSPVTKTYKEKLFQSVIDRSHIDFGDIPKSKGDITKYSGYQSMRDTLDVLLSLGKAEKATDLIGAITTITTSISYIQQLKTTYMSGFAKKVEMVALDYNTYVFTCVEATTTLMHSYIDFIKTPSSPVYKLSLKDTKYRANNFYFLQLTKFNNINANGQYGKYLSTLISKGQENFSGSMMIGAAAIAMVAFAIVPVTRELIYLFQELRRKLSENLTLQAYFLEMNKLALEANKTMDPDKKKKVLEKQEKLRKKYLLLAERLRVSSIKAEEGARKRLDNDNKGMTAGNIEDEVSDGDITIV